MRLDVDALLDGTQAGSVFMERGKPLEVRLRNASGEPVENVRLLVRPGGLDGILREASYRSSEGGIVTIPRIAAGTWGLVAEASGTSPRRRVVLDGSETSLEWSLAGTAVTGQLTLGGRPVTEASVTVRTPQAGIRMIQLDRNTPEGLSLEPLRIGDAPQVSAVAVDAEGRYRIDSVTEDDVILFAAGPGWASQPIRLSLPGRGEVRQDIALGDQRLLGVVRFDDLDEGSYRLLAEGAKSSFAAATLRVVASGGTATVRLNPTGALHLRLQTDSAEYDAARIRIEILDADGHDLAAEAAALGRPARFRDDDRYVLPVLPPGSYRVRVTDHDRTLIDEPARIRVGERKEMLVRLR